MSNLNKIKDSKKKEAVSAQVVIASIEKKTKKNFSKLNSLAKIKTQKEYDTAATLLKVIKEASKEAEEQEATILDPLQLAVKNTKALFKPFYTKVEVIESTTKNNMLLFIAAQLEKEKELTKQLETGKIKKVSTYMGKVSDLSTASNNVSKRTIKELVIVDVAAIPREFMVPNLTAIKQALMAGQKIKGAELRDKLSLAI